MTDEDFEAVLFILGGLAALCLGVIVFIMLITSIAVPTPSTDNRTPAPTPGPGVSQFITLQ